MKRSHYFWTKADIQTLIKMRQAGEQWKVIARKIDVSPRAATSLAYKLRKKGLL